MSSVTCHTLKLNSERSCLCLVTVEQTACLLLPLFVKCVAVVYVVKHAVFSCVSVLSKPVQTVMNGRRPLKFLYTPDAIITNAIPVS